MTDDNKTEPKAESEKAEEIKVPILDLPSRTEMRSIIRTGKGQDGTPVHPDSRKHLRKAVIADLVAFGGEVNKANAALNAKFDKAIDKLVEDVNMSFKEVHWNFATLLTFLSDEGTLKPDALARYEEFRQKAGEELAKAAEALFKANTGQADVPSEGEKTDK